METSTVKILRATVAAGKSVKKDQEIELPLRDAHTLVRIGRAVYVDRMAEPAGKAPDEKAPAGKAPAGKTPAGR